MSETIPLNPYKVSAVLKWLSVPAIVQGPKKLNLWTGHGFLTFERHYHEPTQREYAEDQFGRRVWADDPEPEPPCFGDYQLMGGRWI